MPPKVSGSVLTEALRRAATDIGCPAPPSSDDRLGIIEPGFLFLGSAEHALSEPLLQSFSVTHVLTVVSEGEMTSLADSRTRLHLKVRDTPTDHISPLFAPAVDFIEGAQKSSGRVLVHCMAGRSRSASLVLAFLMARRGMTLAEAWQHVKACRPEAFVNPGFWRQLQTYEQSVHGRLSELPETLTRWLSRFAAEEARPELVYAEYLTSSLNGNPEGKACALSGWSSEWRHDAVMDVIGASFEKLPREARDVAVEMLEALVHAGQMGVEEVAKGVAEFCDDEELASEMRIDIPHYDAFRTAIVAAAKKVGLGFLLRKRSEDESSLEKEKRTLTAGREVVSLGRAQTAPQPATDRDWYSFPDGTPWSLPKTWGTGDRVIEWAKQKKFKLTTYVALRQRGDEWIDEDGQERTFQLRQGYEVVDVPMKKLEKPQRYRPRGAKSGGFFLERQRLERVLEGMMSGRPMPPITLDASGGRWKVANGFHRYFASLILGFTEMPAETPKGWASDAPVGKSAGKGSGKKWVPPSVRRRMEEEAAAKKAQRDSARSSRRMEGKLLVHSDLYAEDEVRKRELDRQIKKTWCKVVGKPAPPTGSVASVARPSMQARAPILETIAEHGGHMSKQSSAGSTPRGSLRSNELPAGAQEGKAWDAELGAFDVIPPERFGMTAHDSEVRGSFPIRVVRELHNIRQSVASESSFVSSALRSLETSKTLGRQDYERLVSLLSLSTLQTYGLGANAPERFGMRRTSFAPNVETVKGSLSAEVSDELTRLTWLCTLSKADEEFLKTIVTRASRHGAAFFMKRKDYERMIDLRRSALRAP